MNCCFQTYSWSTVPIDGDMSVGKVLCIFFRTVLFVRVLWYLPRTVGHSGCSWLPEFLLIPSKEKHTMSQDSQCSRIWSESPWQHFSIQTLHLCDFCFWWNTSMFHYQLKKINKQTKPKKLSFFFFFFFSFSCKFQHQKLSLFSDWLLGRMHSYLCCG